MRLKKGTNGNDTPSMIPVRLKKGSNGNDTPPMPTDMTEKKGDRGLWKKI
jgi:hypothetical protein